MQGWQQVEILQSMHIATDQCRLAGQAELAGQQMAADHSSEENVRAHKFNNLLTTRDMQGERLPVFFVKGRVTDQREAQVSSFRVWG